MVKPVAASRNTLVPKLGRSITEEGDTGQLGAVRESLVADAGDTVWDGDAGQAAAVIESTLPMLVTLFRDGDAGQAACSLGKHVADAGDTVRDGDVVRLLQLSKVAFPCW